MKLEPICNLTGYLIYRAVKENAEADITYAKNWQKPTYDSNRMDSIIEHIFNKCSRSYWTISTDIVNGFDILISQAISECTDIRECFAEADYKIFISSLLDSQYIDVDREKYEKFMTTKYFLDLTDEYRSLSHDKENHYIRFSHDVIEKILSRDDIFDKRNDIVAIKYNSSFYDDSIFRCPISLQNVCFLDDEFIKEALKYNLKEYTAHLVGKKIISLHKVQ